MKLTELAIFGAPPAFHRPISTSNLIRPDKDVFLDYMRLDYNSGQFWGETDLIKEMEARLAALHGAKYCVSVCNGLWGLVMSIDALRLKGKTEIIMPSLTYRRMADIAAWLKLVPHFCDVSLKTMAITAETAESCINENTALILAPHPIVNVCDPVDMIKLGERYSIPVLFDSVEAAYAEINGKPVGSFGIAECFSVHASKFLNGFEGGYVTTNNLVFAEKLRAARNFGIDLNGRHIGRGINGYMISPHAAMTLASIDRIPEQIENNRRRFNTYKRLLQEVKGVELVEYSNTEQRSFKNILIKLDTDWPFTREQTLLILQKENMVVRPYYFPPLHLKTSTYPVIVGEMKNSEILMQQCMLLPCGEFVSDNDISRVVEYMKFIADNSEIIKKELKNIGNK